MRNTREPDPQKDSVVTPNYEIPVARIVFIKFSEAPRAEGVGSEGAYT